MSIKIKKFSTQATPDILNQIVDKHNLLSKSLNTGFEQVNGLFDSANTEISALHNRTHTTDNKIKNLIFHLNKLQIENEVLRKELIANNLITSQRIREGVDEIMRHDLGVDSNLTPVGTLNVTKYNTTI